jgi:hypothetical protein
MSQAASEAIWINSSWKRTENPFTQPITIYCDKYVHLRDSSTSFRCRAILKNGLTDLRYLEDNSSPAFPLTDLRLRKEIHKSAKHTRYLSCSKMVALRVPREMLAANGDAPHVHEKVSMVEDENRIFAVVFRLPIDITKSTSTKLRIWLFGGSYQHDLAGRSWLLPHVGLSTPTPGGSRTIIRQR